VVTGKAPPQIYDSLFGEHAALRDARREDLSSQLVLGENLAGNDQSLYFRRSFVNGGDPGIPKDALDSGVLEVTYTAMNLHRLG